MGKELLILSYHRVLSTPDPLRWDDMPLDCFDQHMRVLKRFFNVVPLDDGVRRIQEGTLPRRAVSITFDDGYKDNYELAWPILRRLKLPATIFVATDYLDGGRMWNDTVIESLARARGEMFDLSDLGLGSHQIGSEEQRRRALPVILGKLKYEQPERRDALVNDIASRVDGHLPGNLMMTTEEVVELSRSGIDIGAHTRSHPILRLLDNEQAEAEIWGGKKRIEEIVGRPVNSFAYPNGRPGEDYDERDVAMVRSAGFNFAVSTTIGTAGVNSEPLQLPRFGPWAESPARFAIRLARMFW